MASLEVIPYPMMLADNIIGIAGIGTYSLPSLIAVKVVGCYPCSHESIG
ncbi:MAG: hypothetical protein HDS23_07555 [Bacteroides sp.]|nr:hypothetical protein [Bacteroides sp.]